MGAESRVTLRVIPETEPGLPFPQPTAPGEDMEETTRAIGKGCVLHSTTWPLCRSIAEKGK